MNVDLLSLVEYYEREESIPRERLLAVVHDALLAVAKKAVGPARGLRVEVDVLGRDEEALIAYARLRKAHRVILCRGASTYLLHDQRGSRELGREELEREIDSWSF